MSWLDAESEKWLKPIVDTFIESYENLINATQECKESEQDLAEKMAAYELDVIERGAYILLLHVPDDGDVGVEVERRTTVDLSD